jgi:Transthyretin-like protein
MATFSSHLLNSINGTHARGVKVIIYQIKAKGDKKKYYESETDDAGRIPKESNLTKEDGLGNNETVGKTGNHPPEERMASETAAKPKRSDPNKKYHPPSTTPPNGDARGGSKKNKKKEPAKSELG